MSIIIKIILDTRRAKKDGTFPIVARLYKDSRFTQIPAGYYVSKED